MFKLLTFIIFAAFASSAWYVIGELAPKACAEPITYSIGSFDRRFGLSQESFLSALRDAEAIWEAPFRQAKILENQELFAFVPKDGEVAINLVYDYRQETTEELNQLEREVKSDDATYRALQREYGELKAEYTNLRSQYDQALAIFENHKISYEKKVDAWNQSNRTSKSQFEALESDRQTLEIEIAAIKTLESRLNAAVKEVNAKASALNSLARELNINVEEYNELGAERGETFTGGLYTADRSGERIDIYEFESRDKLVRVLAHELGHALGLDHIYDRNAIMYELNQGTQAKASAADIALLRNLCNPND